MCRRLTFCQWKKKWEKSFSSVQTKRFCINTLWETQSGSIDGGTAGGEPLVDHPRVQSPITIRIVALFIVHVHSSERSATISLWVGSVRHGHTPLCIKVSSPMRECASVCPWTRCLHSIKHTLWTDTDWLLRNSSSRLGSLWGVEGESGGK